MTSAIRAMTKIVNDRSTSPSRPATSRQPLKYASLSLFRAVIRRLPLFRVERSLDLDVAFLDLLRDLLLGVLGRGVGVREGFGLRLAGRAITPVADDDLGAAHGTFPELVRSAADELKTAFGGGCHA